MPFLDVYSAFHLCCALLVALAVWNRSWTHRAVASLMLIWFFASMMAQSLTGLYSPAMISFLISGGIAEGLLLIGKRSRDRWPYQLLSLVLVDMVFHLAFWAAKSATGQSVLQGHYQNAGAIIFLTCLALATYHKRGRIGAIYKRFI